MKEMLSNRILTGLPTEEFGQLAASLEPVSLSAGETLCGPGESARFSYFPEDAVLSYSAVMRDGKTVEIGMIGKEGVARFSTLSDSPQAPHLLSVAASGTALRIRVEDLEHEIRRTEILQKLLAEYQGEYLMQIAQRAACGVLHLTEQRFAVWLLMLTERLGTDAVEVTHEKISDYLGVRRPGVTIIAGMLQQQGIIRYSRGGLRILNRPTLEAVACECYATLRTLDRESLVAESLM
jgi:CRP-like cAMP-binding protein